MWYWLPNLVVREETILLLCNGTLAILGLQWKKKNQLLKFLPEVTWNEIPIKAKVLVSSVISSIEFYERNINIIIVG